MATYQITTPEKFNFKEPDSWPKWIRRFERFSQASGLTEKSSESQVNTLIYSMGEEADDILFSFGLTDEQSKNFETIKGKFEQHFIKKCNVVYERAKFNLRKQEEGEHVDPFITDLYKLAEHCSYGNLRDELIRDRIVIGVRDKKLSMKLQREEGLTLEKAISLARQSETIKKQQAVVRHEELTSESVASRKPPGTSRSDQARQTICTRCGKSPTHPRFRCPANTAECHRCHKIGHNPKFCKTKLDINEVQPASNSSDEDSDTGILGVVENSVQDSPWNITLKINSQPVKLKIDTGADVTVISESTFKQLKGAKLCPTTKALQSANGKALTVSGKFTALIKHKKRRAKEEIFVVSGLKNSLLGQPAIQSLKLVKRVCSINADQTHVVSNHPNLFTGLGRLEGEYHIELEPNSQPFALSTPRRVALPLMRKVKTELERMEKTGIISKVEEPTAWCAGMVVVLKTNGTVRICVDLTKLNECVKRERHVLPSVEQSLAQLGGATVFSKLDANSGFWQVQLAPESALLTTFITTFEKFCFNRLLFGVTTAP